MTHEKPDFVRMGGRWLRVGALTLTMVGPALNALLVWMRQRSDSVHERTADPQVSARDARAAALQQLDEFTHASRQRIAEQANNLQQQALQLSSQATRLRTALRREKRQSRELHQTLEQLRKAGGDWSQELLKRGEDLTGNILTQGGEFPSDLLERGSEISRDWVERGGKLSHGLAERGGQLSQILVKRGSEIGQDLAERGEQLLRPGRKRNSTLWTIFGFSAGLVAAATVTYLLIRRNLLRHATEQNQQFELPQSQVFDDTIMARPTGAIRHVDSNGNSVASLRTVDVEQHVEAPADAAFVGIVSSKQYYPITATIEAKDVVFFASEEEAKSEGFAAAIS